MPSPLISMFVSIAVSQSCAPTVAGAQLVVPTERAALAAARHAWRGRFDRATVSAREPYKARLADGAWHVYGTLPKGRRGGTPEAVICASDGTVLKVFHSK